MVREDLKKGSSKGSKIFGLLLINALPIAGLVWLTWALATERASLDDLPEGLGAPAAGFGLALVLLIVVASFLLPLVHFVTKWFRHQLRGSAERRAEGGAFRTLVEWLLWPFRALLHALFWILRFVLYLTSLALILVCIFCMVRFVNPDFLADQVPLEEWFRTGQDWISERF